MEAFSAHALASAGLRQLLDEVGHFLSSLCSGDESQQAGNLLDVELCKWWKQYYTLKKREDGRVLDCAVLALTKSGKTTLLNALLGKQLLPTSNVPETARITLIVHTAAEQPRLTYTLPGGETEEVIGELAIREHLRFLNREVRSRTAHPSDEAVLQVHAPVAALLSPSLAGRTPGPPGSSPQSGVTLRLLDTPGPNEAGEDNLRYQVERLLDGVDAVIYLLDYSKLKTQEEAALFAKLKAINPQLVERLSQRLFFVVNKADLIRTGEGLDRQEVRQYVADLITEQLGSAGFRLQPEQVLLISAQDAFLSRLVMAGKATPEQRLRFSRLAFGPRRAETTPAGELEAAAVDMFGESGVPELEEAVLHHLYANRGALSLMAILDDTRRLLHQIQNVAAASHAALQQDVMALKAESEALQGELGAVLADFSTVQQDATEAVATVVDEVQAQMQILKESLFEKIAAVVPTGPERSNLIDTIAPHVVAGRWRTVFEKARSFWACFPGGVGSEDTAQRDAMQERLQELQVDILAKIGAEVGEFWHGLEAATNSRQVAVFAAMNRRLEALARRIEATVGSLLEVRLEPVALRIEPPSAQSFHADLQDLFREGIGERTETRTEDRQEAHVVWERRRRRTGLCSFSDYYVGRPAERTVRHQTTATTFELQPEQIKDYFMRLVDTTVGTSIAHVRQFVELYMDQRVAAARTCVHEYGQKYADAMLQALDTSSQGEEARDRALKAVSRHLGQLHVLLEMCRQMEASAEASSMFPPPSPSVHPPTQDEDAESVGDGDQDSDEGLGGSHYYEVAAPHPSPQPSEHEGSLSMAPSGHEQAGHDEAPVPAPVTASNLAGGLAQPTPNKVQQAEGRAVDQGVGSSQTPASTASGMGFASGMVTGASDASGSTRITLRMRQGVEGPPAERIDEPALGPAHDAVRHPGDAPAARDVESPRAGMAEAEEDAALLTVPAFLTRASTGGRSRGRGPMSGRSTFEATRAMFEARAPPPSAQGVTGQDATAKKPIARPGADGLSVTQGILDDVWSAPQPEPLPGATSRLVADKAPLSGDADLAQWGIRRRSVLSESDEEDEDDVMPCDCGNVNCLRVWEGGVLKQGHTPTPPREEVPPQASGASQGGVPVSPAPAEAIAQEQLPSASHATAVEPQGAILPAEYLRTDAGHVPPSTAGLPAKGHGVQRKMSGPDEWTMIDGESTDEDDMGVK